MCNGTLNAFSETELVVCDTCGRIANPWTLGVTFREMSKTTPVGYQGRKCHLSDGGWVLHRNGKFAACGTTVEEFIALIEGRAV